MTAQDVIAESTAKLVRATKDPAMWSRMDDGERRPYIDEAQAAIDALTAAGYVLVKLPDQDGTLHGDALWVPDHAAVRARPGWVVQTGPTNLRPSEAVARAAALLAAAAHAESVTDD